jgi:DMSO/TMAO reductase YedYZ molybdopterin-dependent catalytic subunit
MAAYERLSASPVLFSRRPGMALPVTVTLLDRLRAAPAPPGPFRPRFWRSPLRGPWLTSVLGLVLLGGLTIMIVTGLLSYAAYEPRLPGNDATPGHGLLGAYLFGWPTGPTWLYRVTQGTHVMLGIALVPVVLAKLWSVIPKLFAWPPVRSVAHALERGTLLLLVGGLLFEFVTGILNSQLDYLFPFFFYTAHFYGAWVFIGAFVAHVVLKLPVALRSVRRGPGQPVLATATADTRPEPERDDPAAPPTISRRGALGFVGLGSLVLLGTSVGQTLDGPLRATTLFAPHDRPNGTGANAFPVNKTAATAGVTAEAAAAWRLELVGPRGTRRLSRADLAALPQHTEDLPIACVEGWSISRSWTGPRLADLLALAGGGAGDRFFVESMQNGGGFGAVSLSAAQSAAPRSLLALQVGDEPLSLDHGFPARVVIPAAPGVHCTKWVARMTVVTA